MDEQLRYGGCGKWGGWVSVAHTDNGHTDNGKTEKAVNLRVSVGIA